MAAIPTLRCHSKEGRDKAADCKQLSAREKGSSGFEGKFLKPRSQICNDVYNLMTLGDK